MAKRPRTRSTTLRERLTNRLSELPTSIIFDILGRIPMRDVVRTCVLSKEWRYTWTSLPYLLFKCTGVDDNELETFNDSTKKFVNKVLHHHEGPIYSLEISYSCSTSIGSFDKWVLCLSRKDIKELIIDIRSKVGGGAGSLKSSIYKCSKLTKLSLRSFNMIPPPSTFKGFLFLKSIVLVGIIISLDGLERLVAHCPVLESLELLLCSTEEELIIRSPNLKNLQCLGRVYRKISLHAPLMEKINVGIMAWNGSHHNQRSICNYTNFLGSSTNLVELHGYGFFTLLLSIGIESCQTILIFPHLKVLELQGLGFRYIKEISVVARLIVGAPNLHKLKIQAMLWQEDGAPDVSFREYFGFAPDFTLEKLKDISLPFVFYYPTRMQFVKFLLESSPVLETMELKLVSPSHFDEVSAAVLGFHRASPNAKITII